LEKLERSTNNVEELLDGKLNKLVKYDKKRNAKWALYFDKDPIYGY
jgi:hypothetical protein